MAINGNNNVNENSEKSKSNNVDLKSKFIKEFVGEKLLQNKNEFIDNVMSNDTISSIVGLEDDMLKFKALNNIFSEFKLDNINIYDLRVAVGRDFLKLENARSIFWGILGEDYDISTNEKTKITNNISSFGEDKLHKYINSKNDTNKLLLKLIPNIKLKNKRDTFIFLKNLSINDLNDRLNNILNKFGESKKKEVESILYDISTDRVVNSDIQLLFELDFFNISEKKELVNIYIPIITLQNALDLGITDKNGALVIKTRILKEKLLGEGLTDSQIDIIIDNTSYSDVIVSTNEFFNNPVNINHIVTILGTEVGFRNLESDFNKILNESKNELKKTGPQNFKELLVGIEEINENNRFKNLNKFIEGNIYKFVNKDYDGNDKISYFKILSIDDSNTELSVKVIGEGNKISNTKYIESNDLDSEKLTYLELINFLKLDKNAKLDFYTKDEIDQKVANPNNELQSYEYKKIDEIELQNNKQTLINTYVNGIEEEIFNLTNELEINQNDKQLAKLLKQKESLLDEYNSNQSDENLLTFINFKKFVDMIDEIDTDGKNIGFEKGIFFEAKGFVYEIIGIDKEKGNISLKSNAGLELVYFDIFYESFKNKKAKRLNRIDNFSDYLNIITSDSSIDNKKWNNHELINGELTAKGVEDGDKKIDAKVDYLISDKNDEILKIINISGNQVEVQFGEREAKNRDNIYLDDNKVTLNINELDLYIKEYNLFPDWKIGKKLNQVEVKDHQNSFNSDFITRFFNRMSINELLAGGKMLVDGIKETMKKGNDLHAAKFALAIGEYLPGEIKEDMLIKVERAESEEMDKELAGLSKVDSPIAVGRIKKWLLNKDTPEYKKEAGVLFMLEKYGHLASKGALYEFRGKWLWYESLGGRINDELFLEKKKEAEDSDITFTEEYLVHILLKKQCWDGGYNGLKRRSRLHKEYENKWKSGINAEIEKGYGDANNKRKASDMLKGGNEEAKGGTTSNAVGWYKKSIERGGSLEIMSEGFFSLLYSGALYNTDQATFTKIKSLWDGEGMPMIMTRFSSYKSDMILFNKVVLELSKKIEKAYPDEFKSKNLSGRAQKLYDDADKGNGKESERFEAASKFWKDFGTPLSRALNISNVKDGKYSKIDKIILLEKETNPLFRDYFTKIRDFSDEIEFKEDLMTDSFLDAGVTGLSPYQVARKTLKMHQSGGFLKDKNGKINWKELSNDISSIPNKVLDINSDSIDDPRNKKAQRKYLLQVLREILAAFVENAGGNDNGLNAYNKLTTDIGYDLNKWKINLLRDFGGKYSSTKILEGGADKVISTYVENILNGTNNDDNSFYNPLDEIKNYSRKEVDNTLG